MKIVHSKLGHVAVLSPSGELSINSDFGALHTAAGNAIDDSVFGLFIGLDAVTRLDCRAIGQLVDLRRRVTAAGRVFGLIGVGRRHREVLDMLRLTAVLGVREDEAAALRSVERLAVAAAASDRGPARRSDALAKPSSPAARPRRDRVVGRPLSSPLVARPRRFADLEEATWPPLL